MPAHAPSANNWSTLRARLARTFDDDLAVRLREPNLDAVAAFIQRVDDAVAGLNRLAHLPDDISPLVEASVVQASLLSLLSCRSGNRALAADLLAQTWSSQASAFGVDAAWVPHVTLPDAAMLLHKPGDVDLPEVLALFNLAVGDHLRKRAGADEGRAILRRTFTLLGLSHDEAALIFRVRGETIRRWEQGITRISDERLAVLHTIDAALDRLSRLFRPDRLRSVVRRAADLFDGERALDWILRGRIAEVADRYDMALSYQA